MHEKNRYPNQSHELRDNGTLRVRTINVEPSMTQQQFKDEADINNIMKKYDTTGQFTHLTSKRGAYADFAQITDYEDMVNTVRYADEAFMALPAKMRLRFNNNPAELLQFLQDPNNRGEAESLGLLNPTSSKEPVNTSTLNDSNDSHSSSKGSKQKISSSKTSEKNDSAASGGE